MGRIGIAGGGIGGLTLAAALQQQGMDVVVFEQNHELRESGAGISLWPNALGALDQTGLGDAVRAIGRPLASGGLRRRDGMDAVTFTRDRFEASLGAALTCVHRGELIAALASRLSPGTVRTSTGVGSYRIDGATVSVQLTDGSDHAVDALVGADGIHSAVATQLLGALTHHYSGYTAWRGIAAMDAEPGGDAIRMSLIGGHEFGWLPLTDGRTYWFTTACLPEGHQLPQGDPTYLRQLVVGWPDPIPALIATTPDEQWIRNDIVDRTLAQSWSAGPVTLMGDAEPIG